VPRATVGRCTKPLNDDNLNILNTNLRQLRNFIFS